MSEAPGLPDGARRPRGIGRGPGRARDWLGTLGIYLEMIKISHSVFALPFAIAAAFLAADGLPGPGLIGKIILACFFARTAAMSFNRWADARLDARNPRTANRAIPAGLIRRRTVAMLTLLSAALFVATAAWINGLAFALSPVALAVLLGYSYAKRFTSTSHLLLGVALGLSPAGAWVAVRGSLEWLPVLLGAAVTFWTAGFDVIYACQDVDFDRRAGLHSIPGRLGVRGALRVARVFHVLTVLLLVATGLLAELGLAYHAGTWLVGALLVYEHMLVHDGDLARVNVAFFALNGVVSLLFMATTVVEVLL